MGRKTKISKRMWNEWFWGWLLVFPTIIGLLILNIIPIFQTLYLSFFKSGAFGKGNIFVGLENYQKMFADRQVWYAVRNTLGYTCLVVPVTMVWKWLYNYQFGLLNYVLGKFGLEKMNWIDNPKVALISIAVIGTARLDGAGAVSQFIHITLPLISPTLYFVLVTSIITAMQVFDVVYMMIDVTNPSYDYTVSLVYLFYNNSFKYSNKGYGSAIVMLLLAIIMVITVIQTKLQKKWVNYM